jgi:hypothetical protein
MGRDKVDVEEATRLYGEDWSLRDLAARYGTSYQTVRRTLERAGVEARGMAKTAAHRAALATAREVPIDEAALWDLAARRLSTQEIGQALGCSEEAARERMVRLGIPRLPGKARPTRNHFWNGGRSADKAGYLLVKVPAHPHRSRSGYVREHRLVMEASLGRFLLPTEVVDHQNFVVDDNRRENLVLYAANADHLRATISGRPKRAQTQRRFPAGGAIPTASETGALPWLERHPLWPFVPGTGEPGPSGSSA